MNALFLKKLAVAFGFVAVSGAASANCNGACPPPTTDPIGGGYPSTTTPITVEGGKAVAGAVAGAISGSSSGVVIEKGAITANPTATATVEKGAITANPTATATVQEGALQSSNVNGGNTVNIVEKQAKQATHLGATNLTSGVSADGCVVVNSVSGQVSAVGVGAIGGGFTTGGSLVKGCPEAIRKTAVVVEGIRSDDPAKVVMGYYAADMKTELNELGKKEGQAHMALFAGPRTGQSSQPITLLVPYNAAATTQPTLPPCVIPGKKASWKTLANGTLVCSPDGN